MNSGQQTLLSHHSYELKKSASGECFTLAGDLDAEGAARVLEAMEAQVLSTELTSLDLEDLELLDGAAVARMVDFVRHLLSVSRRVEVIKSPQSLAHTLYRVGMLEGDSRLELIEPREEEGTTN
ncbi:MAG: STAS domain-containing protein [Nitrospinae bacterium]|nr:STAS domain-containing protein [Nitrospinota bacterium]